MNTPPGWTPAEQIGVGYLRLPARATELVTKVLESNRLTYGPFSREFEARFSAIHQANHAVLCNSGTSALHVALLALKERHGWADGDEVLVPALTFVATANIVVQAGMRPVFVDVDPLTYNVDPARLAEAVTARTRCVIPVHLCGLPADMGRIMAIAADHGLEVIEDSCEAMFVRSEGRPVGSIGTIGCFSTYAAHLLVTGVGGFAITQDEGLAATMRSLCNHGRHTAYVAMDDDQGLTGDDLDSVVAKRFLFERIGYSYRVTELEAAIGLAQIEDYQDMLLRRKQNAEHLIDGLSDLAAKELLQLPHVPDGAQHSFMVFPLILADGFDAAAAMRYLEQAKIETRPFFPLLSQPPYRGQVSGGAERFPVTRRLNRQGFYIGCHQGLEAPELDYMLQVIRDFCTDQGRAAR